jgi:hypothetical protein
VISGLAGALGDNLLAKMLALDVALSGLGVPYAFGGAIALDYYTEPRATSDFDVNVFYREDESGSVLDWLETIGVEVTEAARAIAAQDGQVRLGWGAYRIDLFFSTTALHDAMAGRVRRVPFLDRTIPILAPEHLMACKAVFDRPKEWVDIAGVRRDVSDLDVDEARHWVASIAGTAVLSRFDDAMAVAPGSGASSPAGPRRSRAPPGDAGTR